MKGLTDLGPGTADLGSRLLDFLKKEEVPALRGKCLEAMAQIRPGSMEVLEAYLHALSDRNSEVCVIAASGLSKLGIPGGALPGLVLGLDSDNPAVVKICKETLDRETGLVTRNHLMILRQSLPGKSELARLRILALLAKLGPEAAPAVPNIIEVIKVGGDESRKSAVSLLGQIGPPASSAGPAIIAGFDKADAAYKLEIARVLRKINAQEVKDLVPLLRQGAQD